MRELTGKELDAVCGGLLNFTGGNVWQKQKIYNPQTNYNEVHQNGFVNFAPNTQVNIGLNTQTMF